MPLELPYLMSNINDRTFPDTVKLEVLNCSKFCSSRQCVEQFEKTHGELPGMILHKNIWGDNMNKHKCGWVCVLAENCTVSGFVPSAVAHSLKRNVEEEGTTE